MSKDSNIKVFSWLDVLSHTTEESCYLVIEGKVCDVTNYLNVHPGSKKTLLKYSGTECGAQFTKKGHSQEAQNIRDTFVIGHIELNPPTAQYQRKKLFLKANF